MKPGTTDPCGCSWTALDIYYPDDPEGAARPWRQDIYCAEHAAQRLDWTPTGYVERGDRP